MMEPPAKRLKRTPSSTSMKSSPSSSVLQCANFSGLPILNRSLDSLWAEKCERIKLYDLLALIPGVASSSSSEDLCSSFFEKVVGGMKDVVITVRKKVPQFANLYPLYCSTDQRPDLTVSRKADNLPLILVEVHSSLYTATLKKTILGVTDQLRLYRTHDASITHCVGFAFPKQQVQQCVIMVSVTWERMCFNYALTPIKKSECVRDIIVTELRNATEAAPSPGLSQDLRFLVPLSLGDLLLFCDAANGSPVQLPSRASILVRHGMDYFKSPASLRDRCQLLAVAGSIPPAVPTIKLQRVEVESRFFLKYRGIPYGPLTHTEARSCLYDLVPKLVQVMTSLHESGWTHQDIRLENICFDERCSPVFIDLDRCRTSTGQGFEGNGCMYNSFVSAIQTDWLQLGLMVCWVLDPGLGLKEGEEEEGTYHTRDCKKLCESLKDPFLKSLIGKGKFEQDQLHAWCNNKEMMEVEEVLRQRETQ